jgi:hypothetical protein
MSYLPARVIDAVWVPKYFGSWRAPIQDSEFFVIFFLASGDLN